MDGFIEVKKKGKEKPVKHLVLDTGAIIAHVNLHNISENFYAPQEVLDELRSKKALRSFEQLPFDVLIREPSVDACKAVNEAAKKTGDFQSLSLTDLKVIALTYDLKTEYCGKPGGSSDAIEEEETSDTTTENNNDEKEESILPEPENAEEASPTNETNIENEADEEKPSKLPEGFCEDIGSDDEEGWITEENLADALKKMGAVEVEEGIIAGCLTTDFALQNVLLSMDLSLVSLTGYRIKKLKSFVLRCRACYKTTSNMEKVFCPSCGNKMLYKCPVSIGENGEQIVHINWNRLASRRGLQYSLSAPKGGKHAVNEMLMEDQRLPQNKMAKLRIDPLADGPFQMHDVTSKSVMLGLRNYSKGSRKNPNENKGNRRKH